MVFGMPEHRIRRGLLRELGRRVPASPPGPSPHRTGVRLYGAPLRRCVRPPMGKLTVNPLALTLPRTGDPVAVKSVRSLPLCVKRSLRSTVPSNFVKAIDPSSEKEYDPW